MFGWRARIGYISPGALEIPVYDFYKIAPDGVGLVSLTLPISDWRPTEYAKNLDEVVEAARYLAKRKVQMIVHAGAPTVASRGAEYMHRLVADLEEATGLPSSTALTSAIDAFRVLGSERIAVITPFPEESHRNIVELLRSEGLQVVYDQNLKSDFFTLHEIGQKQVYDFVTGAVRRATGAEIAYVPCPQWHVFEMVKFLEEGLNMPVVTSDGADFWWAFKTLGLSDIPRGHGVLLDSLINVGAGRAAAPEERKLAHLA